ncbi:FAD-binding protein [Microbacterium sp. ARD31]|uniref:FAD-binding protein n=1 Tax=Microbacterium sp. ARD31 TaxID=2962576 RepID=UPI002881F8D3|nr:FAD-binding protein [Microbacterium sp. ARD31]MDT0188304.1 FAD-binding protein [Microbacterium sp. ARD31]
MVDARQEPTPDWLVEGATLGELAGKIDVPAQALAETVARFNEHAARGEDPDFHRGASAYDRYWGDEQNPYPNPSLAPLEQGPYYALAVVNGCFGTSGGIATDGLGRSSTQTAMPYAACLRSATPPRTPSPPATPAPAPRSVRS